MSLAFLEPLVQLGAELGKVAGNDCAEGGNQVDVSKSEMTGSTNVNFNFSKLG